MKPTRGLLPIESKDGIVTVKCLYQTEEGTAKKKEAVGDQRSICLYFPGKWLLEPIECIPCRWKKNMLMPERSCSCFMFHVLRLSF